MRRPGPSSLLAVLALAAVLWNLAHFIPGRVWRELRRSPGILFDGRIVPLLRYESQVRSDPYLQFLPSPAVSALLALGQRNTVSRLRWIGSYPYFQYQATKRDDRIDGDERGCFYRLYRTLIHLDPRFRPFYQNAALCIGGIMEPTENRRMISLQFLLEGIERLPADTALWRQAAAAWYVDFHLEQRNPAAMQAFLRSWAEAERRAGSNQVGEAERWMEMMARRERCGLGQLPYWGQQLALLGRDSPQAGAIGEIMREQLARYGMERLQALVAAFRQSSGRWPETLDECLTPPVLRRVWRTREELLADPLVDPRSFGGPVLVLRHDPWGHAFALRPGPEGSGPIIISLGLERLEYGRWLGTYNERAITVARSRGRWAADLDELRASLGPLRDPPAGGHLRVADGQVAMDYDLDSAVQPWTREELLAAAGL